jgi:hypothetical protein
MIRELYTFKTSDAVYRYTSAERSITYEGEIYTAEAISRGDFKRDYSSESTTIVIPMSLQPAPRFRIVNPSSSILVTIQKNDGVPLFAGKVASCSFDIKKGTVTLKIISTQAMLKTIIPSRTYSVSCGFELFTGGCALNKEAYRLSTVPVADSSKTVFTSDDFLVKGDGYYAGGYAELGQEYSYIVSHAGNNITLLFPLQTFTGAEQVFFYPGCDKTRAACKEKFNNELHYGGFPFVPNTNPVEGF